MKRKAMEELIKWKNKTKRKPLLIYGARQVGKTYLVNEFGSLYFEDIIYVNFEKNSIVNELINENLNPKDIIKNLEAIYSKKIDKNKTLIFFDEIQKNPRALTSLKYFCEEASEYFIIGAGSLLGVYINDEDYSFPVGKVDMLTIYPLSFEEFLINTNNEILLNEIKECYKTDKKISDSLHKKALNLYYDYIVVGGMPEVVQEYINTNSFINACDLQHDIIESYKNDIIKYCENKQEASNILSTFDSIPNQLAKDNKKFQYKLIRKGGSSSIFGESINWLVNAGIVNKCIKSKPLIPIKMNEEIESFKIYMGDIGLLIKLSDYPIYLIKSLDSVNEVMFGMITENYVSSEFKTNKLNLNYWKNDYDSELDFILQTEKGLIIPVEVKSSDNVKSRSLNNFMKEFNPKYGIRISTKNFGFINNIKSVPLYAVFCINKDNLDI